MKPSDANEIQFFEGNVKSAKILGPIIFQSGLLESAQAKSLFDVKRSLARQAKLLGANAVVDFEYGQKSVGFFASIFSRDDVNWYGRGNAAIVE